MQEVGGSIPPGSTNLRRFTATGGKPTFANNCAKNPTPLKRVKVAAHPGGFLLFGGAIA